MGLSHPGILTKEEIDVTQPEVLATDLVIGESARWHDGRLWLSNWGAAELLAFDEQGHRELITRVPTTIPFSIDWLPDGQLLIVAGPSSDCCEKSRTARLLIMLTLPACRAG